MIVYDLGLQDSSKYSTQSAGTVEYADCISAHG